MNPDKALAELCKRSFFRFVVEFWSIIIHEKPVWNWHIEYLCSELQELSKYIIAREPKPYDLLINIPPGTTKSTIVTQMWNAWLWAKDPSLRVISSSYESGLSLKHAVKTRDIIQSPKYRALFPEVEIKADEAAKSNLNLTKGGQRYTTSTRSKVTGEHAHAIIIDDPLDPRQASSKSEIEEAKGHLTTLATRKVDKRLTPTIMVMQRVDADDPSAVMLERKSTVKHICLPAEISEAVKPEVLKVCYVDGLLDPVRMDREVLAEMRVELGSYKYSGQFDQTPAPKDGGHVKRHWFPVIPWDPRFNSFTWHTTVDTAFTEDEKNDPCGFLTWAYYKNQWYIRLAHTDYYEFPKLCSYLPGHCDQNGHNRKSLLIIENKANGVSLKQTLKQETELNVIEGKIPTGANGKQRGKESRLIDNTPTLEGGRVNLIEGPWVEAFLDQLCNFPNDKHDELVDCLNMMLERNPRNPRKQKRR